MVAETGSVGTVATQIVDLPGELPLDCGRTLMSVRIAYETYGTLSPARDNAILICHALSGDAHAAGWSTDAPTQSAVDGIGAEERGISGRGRGWWDNMIGPGKAFDTDKYFVISSNVIGSCRGSTGPASIDPASGMPYALNFPVITVADMVRAQRTLLDVLDIDTLLATAGGSLGGMQALLWTLAYPESVRACISTASTARLGTQGIAWNAIARNAIMADPDWQGGSYYGSDYAPLAGIRIARMVGHVTYLSAQSMEDKFDRHLQDRDDYSYTIDQPDFAVESYLRYQAAQFSQRFDANSYLYLSRALTYFDLARSFGNGSLRAAMSRARASFLLLSFTSDWIYPPADSQLLYEALRDNRRDVQNRVITTSYGHDSFLLETDSQTPPITKFLDRVHAEQGAAA